MSYGPSLLKSAPHMQVGSCWECHKARLLGADLGALGVDLDALGLDLGAIWKLDLRATGVAFFFCELINSLTWFVVRVS